MKITVGVPSRGRPLDLAASLISLDKTKSPNHEVLYLLAIDGDDYETIDMANTLKNRGMPVDFFVMANRPLGLGVIHNRFLRETDAETTLLLWSDRLVAGGVGWDHAIAGAVLEYPSRVLWMDSVHLVGAGQFIITPSWRAALDGMPVCPGIYPFWFEDTAVEEEDHFVNGPIRIRSDVMAAGPRTDQTNRMRDLHFWIDVFTKTRHTRLERARKIATRLGIPARDNTDLIAAFERRDAEFHARAEELTERYASGGEPDASYIQARLQAEQLIHSLEVA